MATKTKRRPKPLLTNGMRLRQPEFHRLYARYPEHIKIELISGEVHMASPAGGDHGISSNKFSTVLGYYESKTLGVQAVDNATVILGWDAEPQPDILLRVLPEFGGQLHLNEHGFLQGTPELAVEISYSSKRIDLGDKLDMYERYGVQEYIVYDVVNTELHWFQLPGRAKLRPDAAGIFKSELFPGLWLDSKALVRGDAAALLAAVDKGVKSAAHRKFVEKLKVIRAEYPQ